MKAIEYPDLAIVGVPKAGTTSLHHWLEQLPAVCAATPKETFYFMDEGNSMVNPQGSHRSNVGVNYDSFFERTHSDQLTLDSTTHHFFQQTAIEHFAKQPTKICVVLREPVSRLVSYFNYSCFARSGLKRPLDFSEFVAKIFDGDIESLRDHFVDEREFFSQKTTLDQGNYQKHLKNWQAQIPVERLKVMFFEDLINDRNAFLKDLASFFGLEAADKHLQDFQVQNEGRAIKSPRLDRLIRSASSYVSGLPFYDLLKQKYSSAQKGEKLTFDWELHAEAIKKLRQHYRPLNEELGQLIPFDADRWNVAEPESSEAVKT